MRITLINPNVVSQKDDLSGSGIPYMPIGLAYLASYLRALGHEIHVIDAFGEAPHQVRSTEGHYIQGLTPKQVVERIPSGTQVIGFYAHLTVASMLGELSKNDEIETFKEKIGEWSIEEGQYRFTIKDKTVYALWGAGPLPSELSGEIKVTEISGASKVVDAATLELDDSPIFVEIK